MHVVYVNIAILFFQFVLILLILYSKKYVEAYAQNEAKVDLRLKKLPELSEIQQALEKVKGDIQEEVLLNIENKVQENRIKMQYIQTFLNKKVEIYHQIISILQAIHIKITANNSCVQDCTELFNELESKYNNFRLYMSKNVSIYIKKLNRLKYTLSEVKIIDHIKEIKKAIQADMTECKYDIYIDED